VYPLSQNLETLDAMNEVNGQVALGSLLLFVLGLNRPHF
jgi:hypothetical protein